MQYHCGDYVIKNDDGLCLIDDIRKLNENGALYYVMHAVSDKSEIIYVPVFNDVKLRPIINKEEAIKLINNKDKLKDIEIPKEKLPNGKYKKIVAEMDTETLLRTVMTASKRIRKKAEKGGKSALDENFLKLALARLADEISASLDINRADALKMIGEN